MFDAAIAWLGERYFRADRRVLGAFRIAMGCVLLADVLRRFPDAAMFYSESGVLPKAAAEAHPYGDPVVSLFFWLETPTAARVGMLALALVYLAYLLGYRTRVAQVLALIGFASLNARNVFVENRGHIEMSLALVWTLLMPLGDRYSIDALLRKPDRARRAELRRPFYSLAVFAVTLQVAAIYGFNAIQKGGHGWESGQAVHYVLWQNRVVTELGAWLRMHEPGGLSPLLTSVTRYTEGLLALLVLSPFWQRGFRPLFFALALLVHLGFSLTMNLWPHSFINVAVNLLLLPTDTVDRVAERLSGGKPHLRRWRKQWRRRLSRWRSREGPSPDGWPLYAREGAVMVMLVAVVFRIAHDNPAVPDALRPASIGYLEPLIRYPRLYQRWSMFGEAPLTDGTIVVDATTVGGRRIDPLNGGAPDLRAPAHGPWHQGQLTCDYYLKIQRPALRAHLPALRNYLVRWHELEGRPPADRLSSFRVYWVHARSPAPGQTQPNHIRRRLLIAYP